MILQYIHNQWTGIVVDREKKKLITNASLKNWCDFSLSVVVDDDDDESNEFDLIRYK